MIYKKGITESEWEELLALEYVLTHYPQSTTKKDEVRYMELSDKKWSYGFAFNSDKYYKRKVKNIKKNGVK